MISDIRKKLGIVRRKFIQLKENTVSRFFKRLPAYVGNWFGENNYRILDEAGFVATRKSKTVFILASGASVNDITDSEWRKIERFDTIAFSEFPRCKKVRVDYHMVTEAFDAGNLARLFSENPFYNDTIYAVQGGWRAEIGNQIVGRNLLKKGARVFRFLRKSMHFIEKPSERFCDGVMHRHNSVSSMVNFCILAGWKHLILVGVDLYDKQYFFLPTDVTREKEPEGVTARSVFPTAHQLISLMQEWKPTLDERGIRVELYNPRSALNVVFPIFEKNSLS